MLQGVLSILKFIFLLLKWPLIAFGCVILVYLASLVFWYFWEYAHGKRIKRGHVKRLKKRSALTRLFVDVPRQYIRDLFNREADFFEPQGLVIFTGHQGSGKTSALIQYATDLLDTYPEAKCLSNTEYKYQTESLRHWKQLIDYKNGHKGIVVVMDELQNWFSSNQSRNFPPEMLTVITQNRKNRRIILGTAQNFYLLAKAIRSQCTEIRECCTLAGVLTIVIKREPVIDNEGECKDMKYRGMYFFVHSPRLRDSYDTYAVIDNLAKSGFHDNPFLHDDSVKLAVGESAVFDSSRGREAGKKAR